MEDYKPICTEYTVATKDVGAGIRVLGYLRYKGYNKFEFQYVERPWYYIGPWNCMNDPKKIYGTEDTYDNILVMFAPKPGEDLHEAMCEQLGLQAPCNNIWQMFEAQWDFFINNKLNGKYPLSDGIEKITLYRDLRNVRVIE